MSFVSGKSAMRVAVAAVAMASFGVTAPQAYAVGAVPAGGVRISDRADAAARAVAAAQPVAAAATANLCGAGYELTFAEQLPDSRRLGTLFTYRKAGTGSCAVFDNNLGTAKYMKLKLCETKGRPAGTPQVCSTDEGNFSQYAGPVRVNDVCGEVTAIMKSNNIAIIDRVRLVPPCK
ncbi:hypothetical protein [Streptomyces sp. WM6368]|uniref:hypothetical protein n=1 Tax=Streptomyces sp. WM6368 TaxID=1415554 RepID=UPI0006C605E0|nr:hypothetical protein [Streptomyces sp. WM6368]KOU37214.1 hypothetical protein ADK51_01010 [Streptomyces sp. WM6368]